MRSRCASARNTLPANRAVATLWHFDAAERAPSTASQTDICGAMSRIRFTPDSDLKGGSRKRSCQLCPNCGAPSIFDTLRRDPKDGKCFERVIFSYITHWSRGDDEQLELCNVAPSFCSCCYRSARRYRGRRMRHRSRHSPQASRPISMSWRMSSGGVAGATAGDACIVVIAGVPAGAAYAAGDCNVA